MVKILLDCVITFFLHCRTDSPFFVLTGLVMLFGMYGIFRKCGLNPRDALIPCVRQTRLGEVTGREKEGRVAAVTNAVVILSGMGKILLRAANIYGTVLSFCEFAEGDT